MDKILNQDSNTSFQIVNTLKVLKFTNLIARAQIAQNIIIIVNIKFYLI